MAGNAIKLYPPIISNSIPAFYKNINGTAKIAVPFSMNKAVDRTNVKKIRLKVKTAQSNRLLGTIDCDVNKTQNYIDNKIVEFEWTDNNSADITNISNFKVGNYLKLQIAYISNDDNDTVGYFSTVAVVKYTTAPSIYIKEMQNDLEGIPLFMTTYTGVYLLGDDKSERPYSYCFNLYNSHSELVETSGWCLHNTNAENSPQEALQLEEAIDIYSFTTSLQQNQEYYIQYGVRTINNLESFSSKYVCIETSENVNDFNATLLAENIFDEGYIKLQFIPDDNFVALTNNISLEISRAEVGYISQNLINENIDQFTWQSLEKQFFPIGTTADIITDWIFRDFTIEQGIRYVYRCKQYNEYGIFTNGVLSEIVEADFEDMFLYDGLKQIKIRFNPKVSSFKATVQEQKIDTIGSKFPFFFRNGVVNYKEFPIGGLISYHMDKNEEWFYNFSKDLHILNEDAARREGTPTGLTTYENTITLNSLVYNMRAERRFKLALMEWLNNGEIKIFKSPAEGNYFVRLMNISLTPEDKLGRMIHNFTANAYEVAEYNYTNLVKYNMITIKKDNEVIDRKLKSINIWDIIDLQSATDEHGAKYFPITVSSIQLNLETMYDKLVIETAPSIDTGGLIYLRIGADNANNKVLIRPNRFTLEETDLNELNVYFNIQDNKELYNFDEDTVYNQIKALTKDIVMSYYYTEKQVQIGSISSVTNIVVNVKIGTFTGGTLLTNVNTLTSSDIILHYYTLRFQNKHTTNLYTYNSEYYYDSEHNNKATTFETNELYDINGTVYYYDNTSFQALSEDDNKIVFVVDNPDALIDENAESTMTIDFEACPTNIVINNIIDNYSVQSITVGQEYNLDYAYLLKTIYKNNS